MTLKRLFVFQVTAILIIQINGHIHQENRNPSNPAFDPQIYEDALDPELCEEHIRYIRDNVLPRFMFVDSSLRIPRAMSQLNTLDMGNYQQCINIAEDTGNSKLEGKYCSIEIPGDSQNYNHLAEVLQWKKSPELFEDDVISKFSEVETLKSKLMLDLRALGQRSTPDNDEFPIRFNLALCIPKTCTTQEGLKGIYYFNASNFTLLRFNEQFCRFKDDKPWVPADYVAITIFSLIGLLTILSTSYDLWNIFFLKKDSKEANTLLRSFSIYSNAKSLTTFRNNPNTINCIDGIRAISMFWIIVGHSFNLMPPTFNMTSLFDWLFSIRSLWLFAAPFSVDTFFFLSGFLVVFTTAGKLSSIKLLKNLHLFYLNRFLRMFPLLAAVILLQISILHRVADGPLWSTVAFNTNNCRKNWWLTLLYVQNYFNYTELCIGHSWYLAIDLQCYVVSPLILYWVLSNKKTQAWSALTIGCLISFAIAVPYCFVYKFPGWIFAQAREGGEPRYSDYYYSNTLTRAPVYFFGMTFGYLLHTCRGKNIKIPKIVALMLWIISFGIISLLCITINWMQDRDNWTTYLVDDFYNSFARPIWGCVIGWIIFACHHGYGGPINWFLCLDIWKLPSRISYGMYLFHYPIQFVIQGTALTPVFFSESLMFYEFLSQAVISFGVAFAATVLFESPINNLVKLVLGEGPKKSDKKAADQE